MKEVNQSRATEGLSNPLYFRARRWPAIVTGLLAFCIGLITTLGWILRLPTIVLPNPSLGGMVLMTCICVLLASIGLLSSAWCDTVSAGRIRRYVGVAIFLIASITIAEMICGRNLGLDTPELHARLLPDYPPPGRMAPNTTLSFLLIGLSLMVPERRRRSTWMRVLLVTIFLIGAAGFYGFWLNLQYFYQWYTLLGMARMALPTSILVMLLTLGLGSLGTAEVPEHRENDEPQESRRIFQTAALVLLFTATATAISSFAFMENRIFHFVSSELSDLVHNSDALIEQAIDLRTEGAIFAASSPSLPRAMRHWDPASGSAGDADPPAVLQELGETLVAHGFSGVAFRGLNHQALQIGTMIVHPAFSVPLQNGAVGTLIWDHGYYLATTIAIRDSSGIIGEMLAQQPLPIIDKLAKEAAAWGKTSTMILCTQGPNVFHCFPQRFTPEPFDVQVAKDVHDPVVSMRSIFLKRVRDLLHLPSLRHAPRPQAPMSLALAGQTGTAMARDFRGIPVMASYTPIQNTVLGLVLKMDVTELYEPVRHGAEIVIPVIGLLILGSIRVMKWRLKPLVDTLVRSRERVRQMALHDSLTGLPNRVLLNDRLKMTLAHAKRNSKPFALALLDVDGFKEVNDNLGHQSGDLLLQIIAKRLTGCVRASDTVARLGGDEFVLILQDTLSVDSLAHVANNIFAAFATPADLGVRQHPVRLSLGFAPYPSAGEDLESLIKSADSAMYRAKQDGGGSHRVFTTRTNESETEAVFAQTGLSPNGEMPSGFDAAPAS